MSLIRKQCAVKCIRFNINCNNQCAVQDDIDFYYLRLATENLNLFYVISLQEDFKTPVFIEKGGSPVKRTANYWMTNINI